MADLTKYPLQDNFETTLAQVWDGSASTVYVNGTPTFTFPSGITTYIVVNPGKTNMQVREITDYSAANGTFTISATAIKSGAGSTYSEQTHSVGSIVRISDNYQFWEDIATSLISKLHTDGSNAADAFDLATSGNSFRIRYDTGDMKFTDDNQSEVSLSTLAAAAWVDEKIKISSNDTTTGYLVAKLTAGNGITLTETNDASNETLDVDVDLTDTTVFTDTQVASRAAKTAADGTVNALITYDYVWDGKYIFCDGSDGDVTISSNTTLTRDMYYNNLTINSTFTLFPDGYKIYVAETLTNNWTISRAWVAGSAGANGAGGTGWAGWAGGVALTANTLSDNVVGWAGWAWSNGSSVGTAGSAGTSTSPSYTATDWVVGWVGGITPSYGASVAGAAGTSTQGSEYNVVYSMSKIMGILSNPASSSVPQLTSLLSDTLYKWPASSWGWGGWASQTTDGWGWGWGGGTAGGVIRISASIIDNTSGVISSIGWAGGAGWDGETWGNAWGWGWGWGGNWGIIYLIYRTLTAIGTTTLTGWAGWVGGALAGTGGAGWTGTSGAAGELIQVVV